jgi:Flp pilus assembly protein TadG
MNRRLRGTALIEFAASLILLSSVFAGIFQIGYTFFAYNRLVHAVRAGARYASLRAATPNESDAQLISAIRNMVVYGDPAPAAGAHPVLAGLTTSNVQVSFDQAAATVSVQGFQIDSLFSEARLDGRPTATFPLAKETGE